MPWRSCWRWASPELECRALVAVAGNAPLAVDRAQRAGAGRAGRRAATSRFMPAARGRSAGLRDAADGPWRGRARRLRLADAAARAAAGARRRFPRSRRCARRAPRSDHRLRARPADQHRGGARQGARYRGADGRAGDHGRRARAARQHDARGRVQHPLRPAGRGDRVRQRRADHDGAARRDPTTVRSTPDAASAPVARARQPAAAAAVVGTAAAGAGRRGRPMALHDPCVIAYLLAPELFAGAGSMSRSRRRAR